MSVRLFVYAALFGPLAAFVQLCFLGYAVAFVPLTWLVMWIVSAKTPRNLLRDYVFGPSIIFIAGWRHIKNMKLGEAAK
jgi:hypothetical protein